MRQHCIYCCCGHVHRDLELHRAVAEPAELMRGYPRVGLVLPSMGKMRGLRQTPYPFTRLWITLSALLLLGSAGYLNLLSSAQTTSACDVTQTTPIRVEDAAGLGTLREAVSCTDGGAVEADWAGNITLVAPIAVAEGTFLSVTGEDGLAVAYGDSSLGNGTRLFEVSPGGGLSLTQLKLSGGAAAAGGGGGAIYSQSANLTLDNCTFDGNAAPEGNGGAVWADGGNVTIVGGEFSNNTATKYGGAVYAIEGRLVVQGGSRFEDNTAVVGGALFCGLEEVGPNKPAAFCSIAGAEFVGNADVRVNNDNVDDLSFLDGGGAAAFMFAIVDITDSLFDGNTARHAGGALHGGAQTEISVDGCTFVDNASEKFGGAISVSSVTVGGGTQFTNNFAEEDGGAVFGWDTSGTITLNNVTCSENSAGHEGGCFYGTGSNTFNDGVVMLANDAEKGGCIFAYEGSNATVSGGEYSCEAIERGGFFFAGGGTRVRIRAGLFADNVSGGKGGAIYCDGTDVSSDTDELVASDILIEGGVFRNNEAEASGGAIALWGTDVVVTITGGTFVNNIATFFGGFIYTEEDASIVCEGANITGNYAGDQGGGIYAREATWVNSSCDLVSNESPQAAAIYLTNVKSATLENHFITDNLASGGSVVYVAASSLVVRGVKLTASDEIQDYSFNRAVQLDGDSTLVAEGCVFDGWLGDAVVFSTNSANGSLVLDSCDFSGSSATMAVISPNSDAEIRNAVVSSFTFRNTAAGASDSSLTLVDRALDCGSSDACGPGECVDSALGVLCECLEDGECLNDGGDLSLDVKTHPANATFSPDTVSYELVVSSAVTGTTNAIWDLDVEADGLDLDVVPSSGVLSPGSSVTIQVTGTSVSQDVGGSLTSKFFLISVGSVSLGSIAVASQEVDAAFYLCQAYEYAYPLIDDEDGDLFSCEQCASIEGGEGVDCTSPGATLTSLPIRKGYWRSNPESEVVHECLHLEACAGETTITSSDDYCAAGYKGPYCAVCTDGYGSGVGHSCHACNNTKAHLLIAMAALFCLVILLLLFLAVVFLIGGLDAVDVVRQNVTRKFSVGSKASSTGPPVSEAKSQERSQSETGSRVDSLDGIPAPVLTFAPALKQGGGGVGENSSGRRVFPATYHLDDNERRLARRALGSKVGFGDDIELSDTTSGCRPDFAKVSARRQARLAAASCSGVGRAQGNVVGGEQANRSAEAKAGGGGKPKCCGLGDKLKCCVKRLPLDKLKILVVVWQILAVFSSITGVEFPASYATFLSWISVVNLDIGSIFSASCIVPSVNFYANLLATTLTPLVLAAGLVLTYNTAKKRAEVGSAGVIATRAAWSRHVAAGLLLTFLVFTSTSTVAFKTFACDDEVVDGKSFLRADYSISCETNWHVVFQFYAAIMILVYPIGIPVLYATILWKNRELLNPRISHTDPVGADEAATRADPERGEDNPSATPSAKSKAETRNPSPEELQKLEEKVKARRKHPELVPSMFLWKDFGPDLYYYEVVECGRRMLLTGVLIFIAPQSATQAAMACIFAFASLLGFELMRPHLDPTDSWLYRLGCVIIFLSNFLALLIKVDAGEESSRAAFGVLLILINVLLVLAVLLASWFATQQTVNDSREDDNALAVAKAMLTAEQYAARSARLSRIGSSSASSASPSAAAAGFHPAGRTAFDRDAEGSPQGARASGVGTSEDARATLARGENVAAFTPERLRHQNNTHKAPWHE